jgi:hypothetical protein
MLAASSTATACSWPHAAGSPGTAEGG